MSFLNATWHLQTINMNLFIVLTSSFCLIFSLAQHQIKSCGFVKLFRQIIYSPLVLKHLFMLSKELSSPLANWAYKIKNKRLNC